MGRRVQIEPPSEPKRCNREARTLARRLDLRLGTLAHADPAYRPIVEAARRKAKRARSNTKRLATLQAAGREIRPLLRAQLGERADYALPPHMLEPAP